MNNIEKDINEIMEYIKDLKEENRKQKEILEILKEIFKYKAHSNWLFDYIKSKEQKIMIVDWLSEDLENAK